MKPFASFAIGFFITLFPGVARGQGIFDTIAAKGLTRLDTGAAATAQALQGPAIIQFWASWCVGCRENMETILEATKDGSIKFMTISVDDDAASARKYLDRGGDLGARLAGVTLVDTKQEVATALKVMAVPTVMVVDASGRIVARIMGHISVKDFERIRRQLETPPVPGVKSQT